MAVIKAELRKPLAKELLEYGINNEVRRYIGKGKKIIPRIIPFVNNNQLDITQAMKIQGIDPGSYSAPATQFNIPAGILCQSGQVTKIPLKTPQDSLYFMHSVRYWASLETADEWPVVAQSATLKKLAYAYDKWNQNSNIGANYMTHITLTGSVAVPADAVTPPATVAAFDTKTLYDGLTFILPLYADDETDPSTADPTGYIQLQIADMAANGSTFNLATMDGSVYNIKFSGEAPVLWPFVNGNLDAIVPMYHFLKVALIATSPKKLNIYGGLANVPRLATELGGIDNQLSSPHVERLYADTLQGYNDGYNQVERTHLFGLDSTITVEIENIKDADLLVNGYIFGYQIYARRNSI